MDNNPDLHPYNYIKSSNRITVFDLQNEGSGSGMIDLSTGTHINYNENGGDPPVQPIIRPIERETPRLPAVVEAVTTQANIKKTTPSSSCRNVYSQSTLLVGLVILGLFSRYNNL